MRARTRVQPSSRRVRRESILPPIILYRRLVDSIRAERFAALATLVATRRSIPRKAGTAMVVRPSGGFHGIIGGGALEWRALAQARDALREGRGATKFGALALGSDLGQRRGGGVNSRIDVHDSHDLESLAAHEAAPSPGSAVVLFAAGRVGRALALSPCLSRCAGPTPERRPFPAWRRAASNSSSRPTCRPSWKKRSTARVAGMTRSHPLDLAIVSEALRQNRFGFVGPVDSATHRARVEGLLRRAGLADSALAKRVRPIGTLGDVGTIAACGGAPDVRKSVKFSACRERTTRGILSAGGASRACLPWLSTRYCA